MRKRNPLEIALGILGLLGGLLYVLACRPAWSPDSSKILFPYCNPETKGRGVALYDRDTGAVRPIFSQQLGGDKCSDEIPSAAWSDDGSRAVVLWEEIKEKKRKNHATRKMETLETKLAHVDVLPVGGAGKELHVKLRGFQLSDAEGLFPLAQSGGKIYLAGTNKNKLLRLDLKSGKRKFRHLKDDLDPIFYIHDGHIAYIRDAAKDSDDQEFGELDPEDLSLHSRFLLKKESLAAYGVSDVLFLPALEPHGSRMAMSAKGADEKDRILVCNDQGIEQVFKPDLPDPASRLGNLEWSRDGKTLFATVITPTEKHGVQQYSLGEIPLAGGPVRLVPIVRADISSGDARLQFQISLSPDGSTIAASTAHFGKSEIDPADRGLFLVDLRDAKRKVTRIQYPPLTAEKATAKE
jgi:hypothetical protein